MLKSHDKTILEILGRNPIHPFPARMAPGIALDALGEDTTSLRVLDPMAGSGTVLAVARAKGHKAFGVDIDPLAVLLTDVWTRTIDVKRVTDKASMVLSQAKSQFKSLTSGQAYPVNSNDETRKFIRYWFDEYARRQLAALSIAISQVDDNTTRNVLWSGFSRLIITKSAGASLAMDLSHSRPHRAFTHAPIKPFNKFISAIRTVVSNCPQSGLEEDGPDAIVQQGDARHLNINDGEIDLVLTSPPYLNAIDYIRCSKFSLVWMGYDVSKLRQIRTESVGTEASSKRALESDWIDSLISGLQLQPSLSSRTRALLATYAWDMAQALSETSRVLRKGGRAVYVVGDSTSRGTFIPNSLIVSSVAQRYNLTMVSRQSRDLPANRRYLPPPSVEQSAAAMDARLRQEIILVFNKQ